MHHQMVKTGSLAPDFTLDSVSRRVRLSSYRYRQHVLVYWVSSFASSRAWRGVLRLGQMTRTLQEQETAVLIIGPSSQYLAAATQLAHQFDLPFSLLADPNGRTFHQYGLCSLEGERDYTAAVLVDKSGVVRYSQSAFVPDSSLDETILMPVLNRLNARQVGTWSGYLPCPQWGLAAT